MSDELEARMWDDGGSRYESRSRGAYFESAFASSEHLDRAPLLSEETYTEVPVSPTPEAEHCHWKPQSEPPSAIPQLLIALVLCGFFMICELIGGYLAGSLSVMCDAAHMLSDCGGFALALLAFHCAKRPPDVYMSYGYKRAEVLGAMVSVLLIWILTGVFVYVAAVRLHTDEYDIEPNIMMIVSGCGVAFNVILALVLHGCASDIAHHHTHGGAACPHTHTHNHDADTPRVGFRLFRRSREHKQTNGALVNGDYSMKDLSNAEANVVGSQEYQPARGSHTRDRRFDTELRCVARLCDHQVLPGGEAGGPGVHVRVQRGGAGDVGARGARRAAHGAAGGAAALPVPRAGRRAGRAARRAPRALAARLGALHAPPRAHRAPRARRAGGGGERVARVPAGGARAVPGAGGHVPAGALLGRHGLVPHLLPAARARALTPHHALALAAASNTLWCERGVIFQVS